MFPLDPKYRENINHVSSDDQVMYPGAEISDWHSDAGLGTRMSEIAAILVRLPLDVDFFKQIEEDLLEDGLLNAENRAWIASVLRQLPLLVSREELKQRVAQKRDWYRSEIGRVQGLDATAAEKKADATLTALFAGWEEPVMRRTTPEGKIITETGVPLRTMLAYLFSEVAKNFFLIRHPDRWIECVTLSQQGDRSVAIAPDRLPDRETMEQILEWEKDLAGSERLAAWLDRHDAKPYDFNRDLDDARLTNSEPPEFHRWAGGSFFRGLALIDLAEAMLKRAFGANAVAVRVNAAGQGDYFQVHIDTQLAEPDDVKQFLRRAFYRRFGLKPDPEFVTTHPGGGAVGVRLSRFDLVPALIRKLRGPVGR